MNGYASGNCGCMLHLPFREWELEWEDVFSRREREREREENNGNENGGLSHTVGMGSNGSEKHGGTGWVSVGIDSTTDVPLPSTWGIPVPLLPV